MTECLFNTHEALGSTPSIKKKSIAKLDFLYRFTWGKILHPPCLFPQNHGHRMNAGKAVRTAPGIQSVLKFPAQLASWWVSAPRDNGVRELEPQLYLLTIFM